MDPGVEVVNLGGEVLEVEPTSVEIQSNEAERPSVRMSILGDVDTLHEAHISVKEERLGTAVGIRGDALSTHVRDTDDPLEVGDRRRIHPRPEGADMESLPADFDFGDRRVRCAVAVRCRRPGGRPEQPAADGRSGSNRRAADEGPTREPVPSVMC